MNEQNVKIIRYLTDDKPDLKKLQRAIENGYLLVKFTQTNGGTELGCNTKNSDSENKCVIDEVNRTIQIVGRLKLDFTPVRLRAAVNLDTFEGKAKLEVIENW